RQNPNTILVGEIRDEETEQAAIHASLTGHSSEEIVAELSGKEDLS
ncbi:Flp pilus assembly complex ATPase component TadA, partial [Acidithiobacillus ferrooxidans]|nr:Flp pilus assembly complex ATPase component TadA [Acidithiobacillus ferrooxidans]